MVHMVLVCCCLFLDCNILVEEQTHQISFNNLITEMMHRDASLKWGKGESRGSQ